MPKTEEDEIEEKPTEFLEELKMNIKCDEDENHPAVLYCSKCEANLCVVCSTRVHLPKVLSNHVIVRLTEKPETPIYCYVHPQNIAKQVCKKPDCDGFNKPICDICHQYAEHKKHRYQLLDDEYDEIRTDIEYHLENIEEGLSTCDERFEYYDKCISSFSTVDKSFWKSRREEVDKFYAELRTSALKKFDDFTNGRIEKLQYSKFQCGLERMRLEEMSSKLRSIDKMSRNEVIENRQIMDTLKQQFRETEDQSLWNESAECCEMMYPNFEKSRRPAKRYKPTNTNVNTARTRKVMRITVLTVSGKKIPLTVKACETIADVKIKIQKKEGVLPDEQGLIFKRKECRDDQTVADCKIQEASIITLVLHLCGCNIFFQ